MTLAGAEKSGDREQGWEDEDVDHTASGVIGEDLIVQVELGTHECKDQLQFTLLRGDIPMPSDRYQIQTRGNVVQLTLKQSQKEDSGHYALVAKKLSTGLSISGDERSESRHKIHLSIQDPSSILNDGEPPIFVRRLSDLAVKVGTRTRFLVEIRSSTSPKVTWHKNDEPVESGSRFSFVHEGNFYCVDVAPVMVDDQGHWTCMAENGGGRSSCNSFLSVIVPKAYKKPEFVEELRALLTETGTVSLECKVIGVPTPVLKWFKDQKEIKAGDVFALTANPDDPTSLGTYTCEAVNCMGTACSASRVHVMGKGSREGSLKPADALTPTGPLPVFRKILRDESCRIGESLVLSCQVDVPPWPKTITWYNKIGRVEPSEKYHTIADGLGGYSIEIKGVEAMDEGEWKCVATSAENMKQFSTCHVAMSIPKNYRMPRFMESLKAVLTEEGLVSFECKVVGFPTPLLRWFKDGQELHPGDVYQLTGTNSLGSYCCIARNCMGETKSIAELTVEDIQNQLNEEERLQLLSTNQAPKFVKGLRSCEARINEDFTFTIQVSVSPEPSLSWYRDDVAIIESEKYRLAREALGTCNLEVKKLEFMDQAEWKCVAANDFGHSVTSCFLKLVIPKHFKRPKFLESLRAILSEEGAVNLECKVIGVPQPILKWYKDGIELKPGDIHRIISGQDGTCCLGTYTCEATNCMGTVSSSASLLGFEDRVSVRKEEAIEPAMPLHELARNLSLSTIHEERTSQLYDTPQTDHSITMDDRGEISFSFDGKEVSVSLYETPDLTEEEALQIVEMYADQLSEHITEGNVIELPPMRFTKETSTTGNLLMEAVVIDVSPDYFIPGEENDDLRTEADVEDVSIMDDQTQSMRSLSCVSSQTCEIPGDRVTSGSSPPSRPPRRKESRESFSSRSEKSEKSLAKVFDWSESYHSAKEPISVQAQFSLQGQDDSGEAFTDALSSSGAGRSKAEEPRDEKIFIDEITKETAKKRHCNAEETIATQIGEALIERVPIKRKKKKKKKKDRRESARGSITSSLSSKASSEELCSLDIEEKSKGRAGKSEKDRDRRGSASSNVSGKERRSRSGSESGKFESVSSAYPRRRESDATLMVDDARIEQIEEIDRRESANKIEPALRVTVNERLEECPASAIVEVSTVDSHKSMSMTNKERLLESVYKLSEPIMSLRSALVELDSLLPISQTPGSPIDAERSLIEIAERIVAPVENLCEQVSAIETKALKSAGDRSLAQNVRISLLETIGGPTEELLRGIELLRRHSCQQDTKSYLIVLESLTDPVDEILSGLARTEQDLSIRESGERSLIQLEKPIALERMCRGVSRLGKNVASMNESNIRFGDETTSCSVIERLRSVYQSLEAFLSTVPLSETSSALENNVDTLVVETLVRPLEQLSRNLDNFVAASSETESVRDKVSGNLEKSMMEMRTRLEALTVALETYERESGENGITELHADLIKFLSYTMDDAFERLQKLKLRKKRVTQEATNVMSIDSMNFDAQSRLENDEFAIDGTMEYSEPEETKILQEFAERPVTVTKKVSVSSTETKSQLPDRSRSLAEDDENLSTENVQAAASSWDKSKEPIEEKRIVRESSRSVKRAHKAPLQLDTDLSLPEMLLDPLIDVQANLSDVISDFESQDSAEVSSVPVGSELAACLTELRESVASAAHAATKLKSASIVDALVDLREPLLDLQLAMATEVSPEEIKLIRQAAIPLTELRLIVEAAIGSARTSEASRVQMKSVLRMLSDIEAEVTRLASSEVTETSPLIAETSEIRKIPVRPPEEVERAAVGLTGVHFALSTALERATPCPFEANDPASPRSGNSAERMAEKTAESNLIVAIEELRQCVGNLAVAIGTPALTTLNDNRYDYEALFDELSKLEEPLLNLQRVLLTEQHGPDDRYVLNDVASPVRGLKEIIRDVTRELGGGSTPIVLELIEDVEKDVTLIAMEALKKALAAKSETQDDDCRASISSSSKPGEVPAIVSKWLDPIENWLTSTTSESTEIDEYNGKSIIAPVVDDLKRQLLKIAIQTTYSEPPSDAALIESLTELQEPLARVCRVLAECHEPENLEIVEGLAQPTRHLLGTILDASLTHEAGKVLRPVLEAVEELDNQIPLTIKRANYERELQRVVGSMTPEEAEAPIDENAPENYGVASGEVGISEKSKLHEKLAKTRSEMAAGTSELNEETEESAEFLARASTSLEDQVEGIKIVESAEERAETRRISVKKDKTMEKAEREGDSSGSEKSMRDQVRVPEANTEREKFQVVEKLEKERAEEAEPGVKKERSLESVESEAKIKSLRRKTEEDTNAVVGQEKLKEFEESVGKPESLSTETEKEVAESEMSVRQEKSQKVVESDDMMKKVKLETEDGASIDQEKLQKLSKSQSLQSETVEVITIDKRPFTETIAPFECAQNVETSEMDATRTDQLDLWTLTLLDPLDRLGNAVLSLDRSIDELAHGLLCRPLDSLHKQIEIAESQFNRTIGQSLENDVETIIEGFLSPVKQLHSALGAAVDVWNDEQPRIVVRDLLRSIADSSNELCELLGTLRKKLIIQSGERSFQARQEDASLVETINAVIAPLDDVRNLIEEALKSLEFVDSRQNVRADDSLLAEERRESLAVREISEFEIIPGSSDLAVETSEESAKCVQEMKLTRASVSKAETLEDIKKEETLIAEELKIAYGGDEEFVKIQEAGEVMEESVGGKISSCKPESAGGMKSGSKVKEDSMDIEETTAKPLEELIVAIVDSSVPRHVSSSPDDHQSITSDRSGEMVEKLRVLVAKEVIAEGPDTGSTTDIGVEKSNEDRPEILACANLASARTLADVKISENPENLAESVRDEFAAETFQEMEMKKETEDTAKILTGEKLARVEIISGPEIGESARRAVTEILAKAIGARVAGLSQTEKKSQATRQAEMSEDCTEEEIFGETRIDAFQGDRGTLLTGESLAKAEATDVKSSMLESPVVSEENVPAEDVTEIFGQTLAKEKAQLCEGQSLPTAEITDAPVTKIKTRDAKLSQFESEEDQESVQKSLPGTVEEQKAEFGEAESLVKANTGKTSEGNVEARDAASSELGMENYEETVGEISPGKVKRHMAEIRKSESLAKAEVTEAPEMMIKTRDVELSELKSVVTEEGVQDISSEKIEQQNAEIREDEILDKAGITEAPEIKIKTRNAELSELELEVAAESFHEISSEIIEQRKANARESENLAKAGIADAPELRIQARIQESLELEVADESTRDISGEKIEQRKAELCEGESLAKAGVINAPETRLKEISQSADIYEESVQELVRKPEQEKAELRDGESLLTAGVTDVPETKIKAIDAVVSQSVTEVAQERVQEIPTDKLEKQKAELRDDESLAEATINVPEAGKAGKIDETETARFVEESIQEIPREQSQLQRASVSVEVLRRIAEIGKIEAIEIAKLSEEDVIEAGKSAIVEIVETPTQKIFKIKKEGTKKNVCDEIVEKIVVKPIEEVVAMEDQSIIEIVETPIEKVIKMKIAIERENGVIEDTIEEIVVKKPVEGWAKTLVEEEERAMSISELKIQEFAAANISPDLILESKKKKQSVDKSDEKMSAKDLEVKSERETDKMKNEEKLEIAKREDAERLQKEEAQKLEEETMKRAEQEKHEESERLKKEREEKQRKTETEKVEREEIERREKLRDAKDRLKNEEAECLKREETERSEKEQTEGVKRDNEEKQREEEADRLEKEEFERQEKAKVEAESLKKEEEEKLRKQEAERFEKIERERREREQFERQEKEKQEAERIKKEEEDRLRKEEEEEEAARFDREERERREKEERERLQREKDERLRKEEAERLKKEERERQEKAEQEQREKLKREEEERLKKEDEERERQEKARLEAVRVEKEEADRLEKEELDRKEKEAERLRKEEADRLEKAELERKEKEAERLRKEEAERLEREELERKEKEAERIRKEEADKLEKAELERKKQEEERMEREKAKRLKKEELEREEREAEKLRNEETERLEKEELERKEQEVERVKKEEAERLEKEESERKKREAEKLRQEELARAKIEEEERLKMEEARRLEMEECERKEREAEERLRKEELERAKAEDEERRKREEAERLGKEKLEREKQDAERLKQEELQRAKKDEEEKRLEKEKAERLEKDKLERTKKEEEERLKKEAAEKVEKDKLERIKKEEKERLEREQSEKAKQEELERQKQEEERKEQEETERAKKEEEERLKQEECAKLEKEELERKKAADHLKQEELERSKKEEEERLKKEEAAELEKEKSEKEREEKERKRAKEEAAKLEKEKLEKEKEEAAKLQKEKSEKEREEKERKRAKEEAAKLEKEKLEKEREEAAKLEKEKLEKEREEEERKRAKEEAAKLEKEKLEKEKEEAAKLEKEKLEKEREEKERKRAKEEAAKLEKEKLEKEREEAAKLEKEKLEKEREEERKRAKEEAAKLEKEKLEKEREEAAKLEKEKLEKEREEEERKRAKEEAAKLEKEKLEKEREEAAKLEKEKLEKEREEEERKRAKEEAAKLEKEKLEKEREEAAKLEKEKLEKEKKEAAKIEKEKLEKERDEVAKLEKEKLEREKEEAAKLEKEKLEKEKEEATKLEKEKLEKEKEEAEHQKRKERKKAEKKEAERLKNAEEEKLKKEEEVRLKKEEAEKLEKDKEAAERLRNEELERQQKEQVAEDDLLEQQKEAKRQQKDEAKRLKKEDSKEESRRSSKKDGSKERSRRGSKKEDSKEESSRILKKEDSMEESRRGSRKENSADQSRRGSKNENAKDESKPLKVEDSKEEASRILKPEDSVDESKRLKKDGSKEGSRRSSKKDDSKVESKRLKKQDSKEPSKSSQKENSMDETKQSSRNMSTEQIPSKEDERFQISRTKQDNEDDDEKTPINSEHEINEKSNNRHVRLNEETSLDREPRSSSTIRTDSEMDSEYSESSKSVISREHNLPPKSRRKRSNDKATIEIDYEISKERLERRETDRQFSRKTRDEALSLDDRHYTPYYSATSRTHEFTPGPRDRGKKPSFCTKLTDRTAAEGSRIKLTCTVLGEPEPQVYWTKDGKELPNSSNRHCTTEDNGMLSLELYAALPRDSGEYSCIAKNAHGQAYTEAKLKVYAGYEPLPALPTFTRSIKDTYRSAENELILECRVRGQPSPKITWLKDGQILQIGDRYLQSDLGDGICRLKISHPDFYDSGLYTCRAENDSKISDCTSHVVNFAGKETEHGAGWRGSYRNLTSSDRDTGRPRFSSYLTDHSVPAGGTIALQVEVKGVPPPDITWMRGDRREPISAYKARTFADSGVYTLIVPEATESETGTYVCRASNAYGYVDTSANVEVVSSSSSEGGKPAMFVSRPAETMIHVTDGEDVSVSFRVNGVPKPRIIWMKGLRDITNGPRSYKESSDDYVRLTLKRAQISDEGTYCIMAKNRYGCDRTFYTVKVKQRARSLTPSPDWGTVDTDNLLTNIHDTERSYLKQVPGPITSEPVVVDGGRNWLALSWGKAIQHGPAPVVAYRVDAWLLGGEGGARWAELGITPVNAFDAFNLRPGGEYKFRITPRNRYGWGEASTMKNSVMVREVVKFPEFTKILPGQLKALRGETLNLECEIRSETKVDVKWYRDTTDIDGIKDPRYMTHYNGTKCTITVQSIKENDTGRYVCEATNPAGRVSTFARVQVVTDSKIVEADEKLRRMRTLESSNEERPPEFTMRLRDRRVQMTYPVRLTCQVSGHPEPEVTWYKNREEIFQDDNISFWDDESHFHTLEISHSTVEDSGIYMAKARNFNGSVSCRCHLVVDKGIRAYVAPEFFRHLDAVYTVKAGGELRMTALIEAYPTVGIVWHRDGHRLRPSRSAVMTLNHDGSVELSLAHVNPRDGGLYCCTATNEVGQTESTTRVNVIGSTDEEISSLSQSLPDVVESLDVPYSKEPLFVTKPLSTEAIEGDTVIILCEVVGDPKPEVIWLRDFLRPDYYRDAAHFRRVGAGPQYRLEIPYAKLDFTGAYTVIAKNCHGEAKAIISLQIYARGQGKSNSSMEQTTIKHGNVQTLPSIKRPLRDLRCCDGDAVTLICRVHATPEPDVRWEKSGKLLPLGEDFVADFDGETARLSIQHVYPEDEGEYTCVAYNDLGKAFTSACLIVDVPEGKESALSRRLIRPIGLLSAESTPISTPRSTPIRSLSPACASSRRELKLAQRTPRGRSIGRRPRLPTGPKFYAVPHNRVAEEGETVRFQCAIAGHPTPWVTWDKDGIPVTPTARISLKENDDVRILEIAEINHEDAGLYRITLENDVGRTEATARLEIIKGRQGSVTRTIRTRSASPRTYSIYSRSPVTSAVRGDTHLHPNIHDSVRGRGGTLSPTLPRWQHRNDTSSMESPEVARRTIKEPRSIIKNGSTKTAKGQKIKSPIPTKARSSSLPGRDSNSREISVNPTNARQTKIRPGVRATTEGTIRSNENTRMTKTTTTTTTTNGSMIPKRLTISRSRSPNIIDNLVNSDETIKVKNVSEISKEISVMIKNNEKDEYAEPRDPDQLLSVTKSSPIVKSSRMTKHAIQMENSRLIVENTKEPRAPVILAAPADVIALRGTKVILLATFDGEPQPRVRWLRKGRDVRLDDKAEIETCPGLTCLTFEVVTSEQTGKYAVTLENIAGRDCRYVNLIVEGVPDPPAGRPCVQSITRSGEAIVTWRSPTYDGGSAVTGYSVEMKRSDEPCWITIAEARHSLSHTVTGLVPEDTYSFRVRAENAHGVSEPSAISDVVTVPGENDEEIEDKVFTTEINQMEIEENEKEFKPAFEARIVSLEDGSKFGECYDVMEELGKGRFGIVRRIIEKSSGLNLAAKFVRTIKARDRQQVHGEIHIMNRLRHPKLLRLAAAFENPKEIIMVTEYISGGELFERVVADDFTLTEKDSIQFVKQICEGVEYMHTQSIVHLDLKPENIMCHTRTSNRIKLIDFGLARTLNPDRPDRVLFGTPEFIPPEIINFEPIGTESDMWSVGVICYVLLSGLSPFTGDNDAETFANINAADYDFDDEAFAAISPEATNFIRALLVRRKESRMSAKQCLEHPWLAQQTERMSRVVLPKNKLKKFVVKQKWQKSGNAIRALGRMATLSANSRQYRSDDVTVGEYEEKSSVIIDEKESTEREEKDEIFKSQLAEKIAQMKMVDDCQSGIFIEKNFISIVEVDNIQDHESNVLEQNFPLIQEPDDCIENDEMSDENSPMKMGIEDMSIELVGEIEISMGLSLGNTGKVLSNEATRNESLGSLVNLEIHESGKTEARQQEDETGRNRGVEESQDSTTMKSLAPKAWHKTVNPMLLDKKDENARLTGDGHARPFVNTGDVSRTVKLFENVDETNLPSPKTKNSPIDRTDRMLSEAQPQNERIRKVFDFWKDSNRKK